MLFDKPISLTDALRFESLKKVLALTDSIGSRDIQDFIPAHIREISFFSARTPYAGYLSEAQDLIGRLIQPDVWQSDSGLKRTVPGDSLSPAQVRARMKQYVAAIGYQPDPDKRGGLQDLSSDRRVNLIIDTQLGMARGQGAWRQAQDSDVLDLWPADELYRAIQPKGQGRDWQTRWNDARRDLGDSTSATYADMTNGPFVAVKNDPIWTAISAFGTPYPPFDYGSGMRVKDVGRLRAIALKVMTADDRITPVKDPLNQSWSVAMDRTTPDIADALQTAFGPRASLDGGRLFIVPDPVATLKELLFRSVAKEQATGTFALMGPEQQAIIKALSGGRVKPGPTYVINADHIRHQLDQHGNADRETPRGQIAITAADVLKLPDLVASGTLRRPKPGELNPKVLAAYESGKKKGTPVTVETSDGYIVGGVWSRKENHVLVTTLFRRSKT